MPETPNTGRMTLGEILRATNQAVGIERERRETGASEPRPWEADWNSSRFVRRTPVPAAVEQTEPSPRDDMFAIWHDEYMQEIERQERLAEGVIVRPTFATMVGQEDLIRESENHRGITDEGFDEPDEEGDASDESPESPPRPGEPGYMEYVLELARSHIRTPPPPPPPPPQPQEIGAIPAEWRTIATPDMVWTGSTAATPRSRFIIPDGVASGRVGARVNPTPNNDLEDNEMRTVGSIVGREPDVSSVTTHPLVLGLNRVGVEIEVEQFTNRRQRLRYWNMVSDGSLRNNGQEFTFRGALGGKDAFDAISEIDTLLYQSNPDLNIRCSTHVHVDVRDMTVPQLKKMILAYAFYESFLFAQSGRHRMKSNFCMPLCIAEGLTHVLMDYWRYDDADFVFQVTDRWDKYSAMNLIPMRSYGSVEFRIAEGKSKSGQLLRLVNRFLALKEVAMANDDKDDRQFLDFLRETDYRTIFRKGVRNQVVFTEEDFKTGWIIANDIATLGKMR